ncbi:PSP1 C-terminal conserved region-domain-containing protein [Mycena maculata]|uniref:PSP1 C-terminal conserved region-domain-containing protein n=1 Tax=Mycena maculata TaxID=230809 RepID=A0AAD7NAS4_9AGAR|nr:PSP1 C-terminal conserved region-domain-containing protein [Mycena maculata]
MSPFVRDVGTILLDDGSFRELGDAYDYDAGVGSGSTSRRHSVSVVQPRRLVAGFNAPEAATPTGSTSPTLATGDGFGSSARGGGGGLLLSDDDLEGLGVGMGGLGLGGGGAGSLPIYAPVAGAGGGGGGVKESWADAYFSPPRVDTSFAQYEGAPAQGAYRPQLSPTASTGGAGRGFGYGAGAGQGQGQGGYAQQQQQPYAQQSQGQQQQYAPQQQSQAQQPQAQPQQTQPLADLGKGLPLHAVPPDWPLYIVEFKAGRTDLGGGDEDIRVGDLVIVEADRGKDLGKVVNDSITLGEVEAFWAGQTKFGSGGQSPPTSPGGAEGGGKKEIAPKMIYGKAGAGDAQLLVAKMQDEMKALALCQTKVRAKKLPMEVVDAEYQWDRRKLTFYFVAEKRIDFRELVRELFRLYKTRIWMASLQGTGSFDQ